MCNKTKGKNSVHFHNVINSAFKLVDLKDSLASCCASLFLILLKL